MAHGGGDIGSGNGSYGNSYGSSSSLGTSHGDSGSSLDFTKVNFRSLRSLSLEGVPLAGLRLTADNCPALECLSISNPTGGALAFFELALPELRRLSLEGVALDARAGDSFAASLGQCPDLRSFAGYRLLGVGGFHWLNLPTCGSFSLLFCDYVKSLDLYAPALATLDCQACPSLVRLRLHGAPVEDVEAFRVEANAIDEARSGALSVRAEEAERDQEVDGLIERFAAFCREQRGSVKRSPSSLSLAAAAAGAAAAAAAAAAAPVAALWRGKGEAGPEDASADGDASTSGSITSGSDSEDSVEAPAAETLLGASPTPPQQPSLTINLLNTHLGAASLQQLAEHPRVGPRNLEGVTLAGGASGLSRLLPIGKGGSGSDSSSDLTTVDGTTTTTGCSAGNPGSTVSPGVSPRSLASPCSYTSGGFGSASA